MKTQNTILKAVNYLSIYETKNKNFDNFKFVGRSIDNPLKVSYIKQEKIDSLLEYTNTKIVGTKTQRQKHFITTSIYKLLNSMFVVKDDSRIIGIATDIEKQLKRDFCDNAQLFFEDDLSGFYSQENKDYIYTNNGSCMNKKPATYFEIYEKFINTKAQIVGLKVGRRVVARAILWTKTDKETAKKDYYLDRIYICKEFENSIQAELQSKLYNKIKRALRLDLLNCNSIEHIKALHKNNEKAKTNGRLFPSFTIQISQDNFFSLTNYPYMDSFRWGEETSNNIIFDMDEDKIDYILEDTSGDYTEGGGGVCECCGERFHEDDLYWSEAEGEQICADCGVYVEERDDTIREEYTIYNEYTQNYHYKYDLNY